MLERQTKLSTKIYRSRICKGSIVLAISCTSLFFQNVCYADRPSIYSFSQLSNSVALADDVTKENNDISQKHSKTKEIKPNDEIALLDKNQQKMPPGPIINFNNVSIVEFLRFASRITGKNFIFDPEDLQFSVTIISETPASVEDVMAALLQNLRLHGYELLEQGPSLIVHKNTNYKSPTVPIEDGKGEAQFVTKVFRITYVDPEKVASIIRTMLSSNAIVELIAESRRMIVTDLITNVEKIGQLLSAIDLPNSGMDVGQYVAQTSTLDDLTSVTEQLLTPATTGQTFVLVPHAASNSIFILSTPFLVEKALSIMQTMDIGEQKSQIFSFDDLKFNPELAKTISAQAAAAQAAQSAAEEARAAAAAGRVIPHAGFSEEDLSRIPPEYVIELLKERGYTDEQIKAMTPDQIKAILSKSSTLTPTTARVMTEIRQKKLFETSLPLGQVESTRFHIHKLQYRKADNITKALQAIAAGLQAATSKETPAQSELITTLNSVQTIEENNSLVFAGTAATIKKARDLTNEIDIPVRQVFIEVLVIDTSISNSLNFGVEWGAKFQRSNIAIEGAFIRTPGQSTTPNVIGQTNAILSSLAQVTGPNSPPKNGITPFTLPTGFGDGFNTGSIGRKVLFNGTGFLAIDGLINALRTDTDTKIIMNPRLTIEHNVPAEIFVGQEVGIKGQSISSNVTGANITSNFEYKKVGIDLKITPLISNNDVVTMIVDQSISTVSQAAVNFQTQNSPPPTINETNTTTRVHVPSDHFLVMSGMFQDQIDITKNAIPCLGQLPLIGSALFANNSNAVTKRNLILFIRPHIIDTTTDIDDITKKQQDINRDKSINIKCQRGIFSDARTILNLDPCEP